MAETVIKIENLYKEYRLGVIGHGTLYRDLQSWWARIRQQEDPNTLIGHEDRIIKNENILALNNINLEINKGEILGIIGANGAGKSTLLKILSKVTAPTSGVIKYKGRIASLLEVGTGFHTELTGRENIYLNAAINGMDRKEVERKLDEIVIFSGVGKFLDTPVKRYSSGMYVRLGFAVAAHLNPDILVVDEVLAVGDAKFQKKAISKMNDISKNAQKTVLFVSHNMGSIRKLCENSILLKNGSIAFKGKSDEVINRYLEGVSIKSVKNLLSSKNFKRDKKVDGSVRFSDFSIRDKNGKERKSFYRGEKIYYHFSFSTFEDREYLYLESDILSDKSGEVLATINLRVGDKPIKKGFNGKIILEVETGGIMHGEFPILFLLHGRGMYEDYDFLSRYIVPPLIVLGDENVQTNTNFLFHIESKLQLIKS